MFQKNSSWLWISLTAGAACIALILFLVYGIAPTPRIIEKELPISQFFKT
jgi:hypothetical protein